MKDAIRVVLVDPIDESAAGAPAAARRDRLASGSPRSAAPTRARRSGWPRSHPTWRSSSSTGPRAGRQPDPDDHPAISRAWSSCRPAGPRQLDHPPGHPRRRPRVPHPAAEPAELLEIINRLDRRQERRRSRPSREGPQVIAVTAAAGGVGCTSLAVNLATTLAKISSHEIVLVDFDLMLGSVDACLDIIPDHSLLGVVQNIDRLDLTLLKRLADPARLGALRPAAPDRDGGRRQDRPRAAPPGHVAARRRRSPRSSSTPARASSRPTSSPSRWPT